MKSIRKYTYRVWLAALLMLASGAAWADVTETEEFEFALNDGGSFSLENINGSIEIEGVEGNKVKIIATKKAGTQEYLDAMQVIVKATESRISVETKHPDDVDFSWNDDNSGSVAYQVTVPFNTELDDIETVNGGVQVARVSGPISADSVNGKLKLSNLTGDVSMDTVNGTIDAQFDQLGKNQRIKADTVNGRIILRLPQDASARVNAETINGSIDAGDFDLNTDKGFVGNELEGKIGAGDARVTLETVNGGIEIERSP